MTLTHSFSSLSDSPFDQTLVGYSKYHDRVERGISLYSGALRDAVMAGELSAVNELLDAGLDPNSPRERLADWTPLHYAAQLGHTEIIGTLLDCHCNWAAAWHLMQALGADTPRARWEAQGDRVGALG